MTNNFIKNPIRNKTHTPKIMESIATTLKDFLQSLISQLLADPEEKEFSATPFIHSKELLEKDQIILDMLNSPGHEAICYCICDKGLPDLPIIFASDGFCAFTGYDKKEIEGKNCRFLQGPETAKEDVDRIRLAIKEEHETSVNLLNYRKDGSKFVNEFFISPLRDTSKNVVYYIGVQCSVPKQGPGQMPANAG